MIVKKEILHLFFKKKKGRNANTGYPGRVDVLPLAIFKDKLGRALINLL